MGGGTGAAIRLLIFSLSNEALTVYWLVLGGIQDVFGMSHVRSKKSAVKCLGAMGRAFCDRSGKREREVVLAEESPAEMNVGTSIAAVILWQKKMEQPPLLRSLPIATQRHFKVS